MSVSVGPLESVVWELTRTCNLRCRFCGSAAGQPRENELSREEALAICAQIGALSVFRVSLMGGEPLLVPHVFDVLGALVRGGVRTDLVTNGERLTRDAAFRLRDLGAYGVSLSLDGPRPVHDTLRCRAGQFDAVSRAAEMVQEAGLGLGVITQVNPMNLPHLEALYRLLCEWQLDGWQLQLTQPSGAAAETDCVLNQDGLAQLLDWVSAKQGEGALHLYIADNIGYFHPRDPHLRSGDGPLRPWLGCRAGLSTLGIASNGAVRGCMSLPDPFDEGSLRERMLADIWSDPSLFAYNRKGHDRVGSCATCVFGALCGGGCAAFSHAATGRIGAMPLCLHHGRGAR